MGCLSVFFLLVGGFLIYAEATGDAQIELILAGVVIVIFGIALAAFNESVKKASADKKSKEQTAKINAIMSKYARMSRDQKIMRMQHISRQMQALEVEIGVENLKTGTLSLIASNNLHKQYMELKLEYEVLESLL